MHPDVPNPSSNNEAPRGLPPVAPPSGRFIAQLFLVPGLIIAVGVFIYLGSSYLVRSSHTPESFLKELDSTNPEIRWRGAHDLAQVLKRPESVSLATNVPFALDLAERLDQALADVEKAEKETADKLEKAEITARAGGRQVTQAERDAAWRKLSGQRNHVLYLIACLGDFPMPVGVSPLSELALKDTGAEVKGLTLRRRRAVWALANLGDNIKRRYRGESPKPDDKPLTAEQKDGVAAALKKEAEGTGKRAAWAKEALRSLEKQPPSVTLGPEQVGALIASAPAGPLALLAHRWPRPSGVDAVLERVAGADDPYLRSLVALALNFWDGPRAEPTLLRLARDDGHGQRIEITETD
jgi:hypothetical protein